MNFNTSSELTEYLDKEEKLIWTGQPKSGIIFKSSDLFLIPFSIIWCGFAFFWFFSATNSGAPFIFSMFGIPFMLIGLYFVFGRFIFDAKLRKNTFYGVTNERIIIKSGVLKKTINSYNIKTLSYLELEEKSDKSGIIFIAPKNPMNIWGNGMNWMPGTNNSPSIEYIEQVKQVYNIILEIKKQ